MKTIDLKKVLLEYDKQFKELDSLDISMLAELVAAGKVIIWKFLNCYYRLHKDDMTIKEDEFEFFDFFKKCYNILEKATESPDALRERRKEITICHMIFADYYLNKYDATKEEVFKIDSGFEFDKEFSDFEVNDSEKFYETDYTEWLFTYGKKAVLFLRDNVYPEGMKAGDILRVLTSDDKPCNYLVVDSETLMTIDYELYNVVLEYIKSHLDSIKILTRFKKVLSKN